MRCGRWWQILPKRALFRVNLALYANYASDFQTGGTRGANDTRAGRHMPMLALAFAQLGQGQLAQAIETYQKLGTIDALGAFASRRPVSATWPRIEGRFSDAVRILEQGAAADLTPRMPTEPPRSSRRSPMHSSCGDRNGAADCGRRKGAGEQQGREDPLPGGADPSSRRAKSPEPDRSSPALPRSFRPSLRPTPKSSKVRSRLKEGDRAPGDQGPDRGQRAARHLDRPLRSRAGLSGSRRVHAGRFRVRPLHQAPWRGAVVVPGRGAHLRLFPAVYYYQGRVREGLKSAGFAESYRAYLNIRGKSKEDPLLPEVRRRAGL